MGKIPTDIYTFGLHLDMGTMQYDIVEDLVEVL